MHSSYPSTLTTAVAPPYELGDLLLDYLRRIGCEYIFGVPGGAIEPLYNALARDQDHATPISTVGARHETGAAFMAQGYSLVTGQLGICCATSGPGATNALTGVASAYLDKIPMLIITGQTSRTNFGRGALQDSSASGVDTLSIFDSCTVYNALVVQAQQLEQELANAISAALEQRGPAHLSIPVDVMRSLASYHTSPLKIETLLQRPLMCSDEEVSWLAQRLNQSQRCLMFVGEHAAHASEEIARFCERNQISIVTTPAAKGMFNSHHTLMKGVFGFASNSLAREMLLDPELDTILAVGTELNEWETEGWNEHLLSNKLVQIAPGLRSHRNALMSSAHLFSDAKKLFQRLNQIDLKTQADTPISVCTKPRQIYGHANGLHPALLLQTLEQQLADNAIYFADAGNSTAWALHDLQHGDADAPLHSPQRWFYMSSHYASMGWAIGAAIGAAVSDRERPVVCITGDGSLLMNGQELSVARQLDLPVLFVVLNDSAYGMVKHGQRMAGAESIAWSLPDISFARLAQAMGVRALEISTLEELETGMNGMSLADGPVLLDIKIDPEAVPPMGSRIQVLGNG